MITRFRVQNYKALRDVTLDLTPIHVLIGPNDSGKTSILEAIAALCRSVDHKPNDTFVGSWDGSSLVWRGDSDLSVKLWAKVECDVKLHTYKASFRFATSGRKVEVSSDLSPYPLDWTDEARTRAGAIRSSLSPVHFVRWNPRVLALPVAPDSKRRYRMEPSGFGLALCLDDILGFDREQFVRLEDQFRMVFPQIKSIKLVPELAYKAPVDSPTDVPVLKTADGKGIYFELTDGGHLVPASQASDGTLLTLAYLTLLHLPEPPKVVLVEEPENGIHPKRLQDVLSILRDLVSQQTQTQIIMTTHSPYLVDLFEPEEVTLCQKQDDGSVAVRRLCESKTVRKQMSVFTLGEIWTGEGDEALLQPVETDGEAQG